MSYEILDVLPTALSCKHAFTVSFNGEKAHRYDIDLSDPLPVEISALDTDAEKIDALLTLVAGQHAKDNAMPVVPPEAAVVVKGGKIDPTEAKAAFAVLKAEREATLAAEAERMQAEWLAGEPERVKAAEELAAKAAAGAELKALAAALAAEDAAEALEAAKLKAMADAQAAASAAEALIVQQAVDAAVAKVALERKIADAVAAALTAVMPSGGTVTVKTSDENIAVSIDPEKV